MSVIHVNNDSLAELEGKGKPILVDFYATWCGPCRMVAPIIDEIAEERDDVTVVKVNIDENPKLANKFEVYSIPTLIVLKDGSVASKSIGYKPKKQIIEMLD